MLRYAYHSLLKALTRRIYPVISGQIESSSLELKIKNRERLFTRLQAMGTSCNVHISTKIIAPQFLALGNNVHIGEDCYLQAEGGIHIGDNVHISRRVVIYASDHDFKDSEHLPYGEKRSWRQVNIKRNAWIGMNAQILPGVTIGEGAIVAMGAIVTKDVPDFAIAGSSYAKIIGKRDEAKYEELVRKDAIGGKNGKPISNSNFLKTGTAQEPRMVFIVTTGRSGSTSIADTLNNHPNIDAKHEPRGQLIRLSTQYARGEIDTNNLRSRLKEIFLDCSVYDANLCRIESDQKMFNLIPHLADLLPNSKFIWLTRSGVDVVASTYGRGWYATNAGGHKANVPWYWNEFRITGVDAGEISASQWDRMSTFAKCCWYWSYVNRTIEKALSELPDERWRGFKLETLNDELQALGSFVGESLEGISLGHSNKAWHSVHSKSSWSDEEKSEFAYYCNDLMERLYPKDLRARLDRHSSLDNR